MRPSSGQTGHEGGEASMAAEDNSDSIETSGPWKRLHLLKVGKSATKRENWPARPSCPQRTYFGSLPLLGHSPYLPPAACLHRVETSVAEDIDLFHLCAVPSNLPKGISGSGEERVGFRKLTLVRNLEKLLQLQNELTGYESACS
ncbi:hypothetical protein AVEN_260168-1 [Araneus ventricosus]|uniref:Uncharacterized protein n=1 Tax=Araneus ventricosus TaxID=182803 RepID=A0A4Y2DP82_ARAVE|nr:hypothetical protein AVEN_260168-1 [Araneus ventricosus]